jgi:hypothetical protein
MNAELSERDTYLVICALGLGGAAGAVIDEIKKAAYHGHDLDIDLVVDAAERTARELRDILIIVKEGIEVDEG